jgi:hypothetical protein
MGNRWKLVNVAPAKPTADLQRMHPNCTQLHNLMAAVARPDHGPCIGAFEDSVRARPMPSPARCAHDHCDPSVVHHRPDIPAWPRPEAITDERM